MFFLSASKRNSWASNWISFSLLCIHIIIVLHSRRQEVYSLDLEPSDQYSMAIINNTVLYI